MKYNMLETVMFGDIMDKIMAASPQYPTAYASGAMAPTVDHFLPPISKRIKIPWKMYKFVNIEGDSKKSLANATIIGESIKHWWNSVQTWSNYGGGFEIKGMSGVRIHYINLVIDDMPIEIDNKLTEKLCIMSIGTFKTNDPLKVKDNDFIFKGTMKISKTDTQELVAVSIEGIDPIAGKYILQP